MCDFFSFLSDGEGKITLFTAEQRRTLTEKEVVGFDGGKGFDSHSVIANFFKLNVDKCNKYEYSLKGVFITDQINTNDDTKQVKKWLDTFRNSGEWAKILEWLFSNCNSGYCSNSGYRNSGNYNGNCNSGYRNSGNYNGNCNSGYRNSGNYY